MFSGIITAVGNVHTIDRRGKKFRVRIACSQSTWMRRVSRGVSVSVDGICLTTVEYTENSFGVDIALETARVTTVEQWKKGTKVNLELPVTPEQMISGHLVLGHVDGVGTVIDNYTHGNGRRFIFEPPEDLFRFLPYKGSVSVNGVSLTIANVDMEKKQCIIALIPHTLRHTNLGSLRRGHHINLEVDAVARYLDHLLEERLHVFEKTVLGMHTEEHHAPPQEL